MIKKIILYVIIRVVFSYLIFFGFIEKSTNISILRIDKIESVIYFIWMLGVPIILETILFTPIIHFLLKKPLIIALSIFVASLLLEFLLGRYLFSMDFIFLLIKVACSVILFLIAFRKTLSKG